VDDFVYAERFPWIDLLAFGISSIGKGGLEACISCWDIRCLVLDMVRLSKKGFDLQAMSTSSVHWSLCEVLEKHHTS